MNKEKLKEGEEVDFTGHSEKQIDLRVDLPVGQWVNISGTPVFKKNPIGKKKFKK